MMNNGIPMNPMHLMQMLQNGANPNQLAHQLIQRNPAFRQAAQFMNGKTPQQIQKDVQQMAAQRGVDLNQLAKQLGIRLPY
jgi:uncharacterized protein YidB (DUF937 family)